MSGKMSRNKGNSYEREIAKILQDWWGGEFSRTPLSGGWHKKREENKRVRGDLITPEDFPFLVECKKRENWNLDQILNPKFEPLQWFMKLLEECEDKEPFLVFSKNRTPNYIMIREIKFYSLIQSFEFFILLKRKYLITTLDEFILQISKRGIILSSEGVDGINF